MEKVKLFLETIKFEHTLFALPFAYLGLILGEQGWPHPGKLLWVTLAMVGLRTVGMIANRLADLDFDRENPRTSRWPLSMGLISKRALAWVCAPALFIYYFAAYKLNPLCFLLSPIPVAMIFTYPYLKRYTWLCHIFLGGILAMAPVGGWMASRGVISLDPLPLAFAVLFWVAGFDIIYSLQDEVFDRSKGLFSIPAKLGRGWASAISAGFHVLAVLSLVWLGGINHLHVFYWTGIFVATIAVFQDHVRGPKLFFLPNISFSLIVFVATWLDLVMR
ncbi:MAG: UbiA family prenyltransferase [Candidatus Omnitrophica bacterium]|nr:UbiA family prenyltransferase [Candidatus Omnitrophota bacterium]